MFVYRKGGGSKYTFISIIIILAVLFIYRYSMPQRNVDYPATIHYSGSTYEYYEDVRSSPIYFKRVRGASEEGHMVLARRGSKYDEVPLELYIYQGSSKYRKYVIKN